MKYKYTHFLLHDEYKFALRLIKIISENDILETDNHLFITRFPKTYNQISKFKNTILDQHDFHYLLLKYGINTDFIFVHALNYNVINIIFRYPKKFALKTIWRTWGHDVFYPKSFIQEPLKFIFKFILFNLYIRKIQQFRLIGIANVCDEIICKKYFKNVKTLILPYRNLGMEGIFKYAYEYGRNIKKSKYRIMVGHSGYPSDNHLINLKRLYKYFDKQLIISLVLSYGEKDYIESVKEKANELFGDKVEIIQNMMSYEEYIKYLSTVDVAIMDQLFSSALGNISILLYMGKKIYLNRNGIIQKGFSNENVPFIFTDQIGKNII